MVFKVRHIILKGCFWSLKSKGEPNYLLKKSVYLKISLKIDIYFGKCWKKVDYWFW